MKSVNTKSDVAVLRETARKILAGELTPGAGYAVSECYHKILGYYNMELKSAALQNMIQGTGIKIRDLDEKTFDSVIPISQLSQGK